MRAFILAAIVSLAAAQHPHFEHPSGPPSEHSSGPPSGPPSGHWPFEPFHTDNVTCISAPDASLIATKFGLTISNYTEALAVQLLAEGFTDQSDSVNTLIHEPGLKEQDLGPLTFSSKQDFLDGQGAQPPVPFEILNLWNTCDTVIIRWVSKQSPYSIQGISIATVQPAKEGEGGGFGVGSQKWQIKSIVAEFNSGAWLGDLGYPECAVVANATTNATAS